MEITKDWIAQQRTQYCGTVKYEYDFYALSDEELRNMRGVIKLALDALEAAIAENEQLKTELAAAKWNRPVELTGDAAISFGLAAECSRLQQENKRLTAERDAEKRRADMATSDIKELMASCPSDFHPCDWCEEYDNGACADRELAAGVVVCRPKWRGVCAENAKEGRK